jgi:hypothetical protein
MRTALEMATFFWVGPISLLAAGKGKTGARTDSESQAAEIQHGEKGELKHQGAQPGLCRGRNHGDKGMDGGDGMGWGQESQTPKGLDGAPPKGELATWGRDPMSTAHCPAGRVTWTGARVQSPRTSTEKQWGKRRGRGCALAAVSIREDGTSPSLSRPRRKGTFVSPFTPWEKRLARAVTTQASDAPTARQTKPSQGRGSQSGPCFLPGCGMATCPQCAAACMHTEQGLCFESR